MNISRNLTQPMPANPNSVLTLHCIRPMIADDAMMNATLMTFSVIDTLEPGIALSLDRSDERGIEFFIHGNRFAHIKRDGDLLEFNFHYEIPLGLGSIPERVSRMLHLLTSYPPRIWDSVAYETTPYGMVLTMGGEPFGALWSPTAVTA